MRLMIAQINPILAQPKANLKDFEILCRIAMEAQVDLIALPELAFTGYNIFNQLNKLAETIEGNIVSEVIKLANKNHL